MAAPAEPTSLDPGNIQTTAARNIFINTHNSLIAYNLDTYELEPELATSWEFSDDGLTLTLHLRDDVTFHNGQKMTAADAAWSIKQNADPDNSYTGGGLTSVKDVKATDDYTVEIQLKQPDYTVPSVLPDVYVRPDGWKFDPKDPDAVKGTGTGAFIFEKWVPNNEIVLKKDPNYWRTGYPKLDEIHLVHVADSDTAVLQLKSGQLDILPYPPFTQVKKLQETTGVQLVQPPPGRAGLYDLRINFKHKPWGDVRVRQALAYALDRDAIKQALLGLYDPTSNPIPATSEYFSADAEQYSLNIEKAKQLLADAGYPDGVDGGTLMTHFQLGTDFQILSQLIQAQAAAAGITLKVQSYDVPTFVDRLLAGDFDIGLSQTLARQTAFDLMYHNVGGNRASYGGYAEVLKDYNAMIDSLRSMDPNSSEFMDTIKKSQVEAMKNLPVIIVGTRPQPVAVSDKVKGFKAHATGYVLLEDVSVG